MPQRSILGLLLFLIYINHPSFVSVLDLTMYTDDTSLFYSHKEINPLVLKVNNELHKINQWLISNKLSLDKYIYFSINMFPLLPKLEIDNYEIMQKEPIKFLGVLQDENLTWKSHIMYIEKNPKNIGLLF